jgi:hypothetical protein
LGSWVVKDVLAHPSSAIIAYSYEKIGVKFVDHDIEKGIEDAYRRCLKQNWTIFNFDMPKPQSDVKIEELVSYLRQVDENFDTLTNEYSAADSGNNNYSGRGTLQTTDRDQDLAIWMSDNRLADPGEVCSSIGITL